jgi:hypothetical protein
MLTIITIILLLVCSISFYQSKKVFFAFILHNFEVIMNLRFCVLLALMFFCSCARQISITSNAFADLQSIPYGFPMKSSFFIITGQNDYSHLTDQKIIIGQNDNPMLSKEVTHKIGKVLEEKGYLVDNIDNADYYLVFNFVMTSSKATMNVPLYIPGPTQTTQGNIYGYGGYVGYQQQTQTSGSYIYVPKEYVFFHRGLYLQVYDAKLCREKKQEAQLWQGSAISSGDSSNLRDIMNYLLITAFKYLGKNTQKDICANMSSNNKKVKKLRNSLT